MKILVTIKETQVTYYTYEVDDVNSLDEAAKCANAAYRLHECPNTYLYHMVPCPPTAKVDNYNIVES